MHTGNDERNRIKPLPERSYGPPSLSSKNKEEMATNENQTDGKAQKRQGKRGECEEMQGHPSGGETGAPRRRESARGRLGDENGGCGEKMNGRRGEQASMRPPPMPLSLREYRPHRSRSRRSLRRALLGMSRSRSRHRRFRRS